MNKKDRLIGMAEIFWCNEKLYRGVNPDDFDENMFLRLWARNRDQAFTVLAIEALQFTYDCMNVKERYDEAKDYTSAELTVLLQAVFGSSYRGEYICRMKCADKLAIAKKFGIV